MKKKDIPQDNSKLASKNIKELCYAVDENGNYTTGLSTGWEPKTIALSKALEDIDERVTIAKQRVLNKEASPIEYYMEVNRMDLSVLASYVGMWKWRVKRHFKPKVFKRLSTRVLMKYANVFDVSLEQLKQLEDS